MRESLARYKGVTILNGIGISMGQGPMQYTWGLGLGLGLEFAHAVRLGMGITTGPGSERRPTVAGRGQTPSQGVKPVHSVPPTMKLQPYGNRRKKRHLAVAVGYDRAQPMAVVLAEGRRGDHTPSPVA